MRFALLAAASAALVLGAVGAEAAPLVPLVADGGTPSVTLVAQGCGLGYSRGSSGRCRSSQFGFGGRPRPYSTGVFGGYGYGRPYGYGYGYRRHYGYY